MELYTRAQTEQIDQQHFAFIEQRVEDHVLCLTFNRAEKKNALHPQMVNEIAYVVQYAFHQPDVWMLLLEAKGDVFCAGADLKAFAGMAVPHDSSVPPAAEPILVGQLFRQLQKPVICKVGGDVYAGGFLFLASAQVVVASEGIKLALPEVKRGLFPFQVMESLLQVMPARKVLDWCIRGYDLPVREAERYGLITESCPPGALDSSVNAVIAELKNNSPKAISMGLQAYDHIRPSEDQQKYLLSMLQQTMMSQDGQEGLRAFREKRSPVWTGN